MKIPSIAGLFLAAMCCFSCKGKATQTPAMPAPPKAISSAQVDSFRNLSGQPVPAALWRSISEDSIGGEPLHFLSGNLDADAANEVVLWHAGEEIGRAFWLDQRGETWSLVGKIDLNFFHGDNPPRIDSAARMLLTYDHGWGSGYGSEVLNFYQNQHDSLVCVLRLLESEGMTMVNRGAALRLISTTYEVVSVEKIMAEFRYRIICSDEGPHYEKVIFERKTSIPHLWSAEQNCFLPQIPSGFSTESIDQFIEEGEFLFDPFFQDEVEKIKWNGPRWKRKALGNPNDI